MNSKKPKKSPSTATFKRSPRDSASLHPAARVRAELTLSGAFRIPPPKPVKSSLKLSEVKAGVNKDGTLKPKGSDKTSPSYSTSQSSGLRKILDEETRKSFGNLKVKCPVALVHQDEDVLVALLAIAASSSHRTKHKPLSDYRHCLEEENPADSAVSVDVLRSDLLDLLGRTRNEKSYESLFHSLVRLTSTQIVWKENHQDPEGNVQQHKSRLIGFHECPWEPTPLPKSWIPSWADKIAGSNPETDEDPHPPANAPQKMDNTRPNWTAGKKPLTIVISSYLSAPILDAKTKEKFGLHWTAERAKLGPSARCLYSQLSAIVWPGKTVQTNWDDLVGRLFSRIPDDRTRGIAVRLLKKMPPGWSFDLQGRGKRSILVATRPPIKQPKIMQASK